MLNHWKWSHPIPAFPPYKIRTPHYMEYRLRRYQHAVKPNCWIHRLNTEVVWGETPLGRLVVFEQCFSGVSPSVDCFSNGLGWDTTGAIICFRTNALVVSRPLFMVSGMVWSTSGSDFLFSKNHGHFGRWKGADYVGFNRCFWNYLGPTWGLPWPTSRLPWACGPTWELEMLIFHWF